MARNYPRFIFSHPFDTKSKERFIVHTLYPQMIAKVIYLEDGGHQIEPLESFVETTTEQRSQIAYRMYDWYTNIRMQEAKLSFDFYDRVSDIARKLACTDEFFDGVVTISMVFIPVMGAKLEVKQNGWNLKLNFENDDTYESTVLRLKKDVPGKVSGYTQLGIIGKERNNIYLPCVEELTCTYKGEEYSVRDDGSVFRHPKPGKKPRPYDNQWTFGIKNEETGYMIIASIPVHRIVATAFHGEAPTSQHVVDHKDTNKCNNRPENLRWVTKFENIMLNQITVKKIEWVIGDKIEKFLEDPAKYKDKFQDQNFAWMRTVTTEEGQRTLERLRDWAKSGKQPSGGSLGEWVYSRGNIYEQEVEDLSKIIPSKTANAGQRNYKMLCDFPFCPPSVDADPIAAYKRRLGPGNVFVACEYFISSCYSRTVSADGSSLYVISESQGRTGTGDWQKVTCENGQFVLENLGVFLEKREAERRLVEVRGVRWTDGSPEEEMPEMAEVPDVIPSKTPGAVQRNWKTVSEFPGCPQELTGDTLITYAKYLAPNSVFSRNDYGSSIVKKTQFSQDKRFLYVITESDSATAVKRWALAQVTYEEGLYVHENCGSFFEERGAERALCEATGGEWKGEEGIDDWA